MVQTVLLASLVPMKISLRLSRSCFQGYRFVYNKDSISKDPSSNSSFDTPPNTLSLDPEKKDC
jgi:hypothetical protein